MTVAAHELRRPMVLGEILRGALSLYRRNFAVFIAIVAVAVPVRLADIIGETAIRRSGGHALATMPLWLPTGAVGLITSGALVYAVATAAEGSPAEFGHSYKRALDNFGSLFFADLRIFGIILLIAIPSLFISVGFFIAFHFWALIPVVPLAALALCLIVYFFVRWAFYVQAVVIEGANSPESLGRSAEIVKGAWWRTFRVLFTLWVMIFVVTSPASLITWAVSRPAGQLLGMTFGVPLQPFVATVTTLLFFELSSRERERASIA